MHADISTLVSILVVAVVIVVRFLRPIRMRASRLWVSPAILILLTIFLVFGEMEQRASPLGISLGLILGLALGTPFGLLRGRHTDVRKTDDPKVLVVQPSIAPLLIWLVAFGGRFALRAFLPTAGPDAVAASDGLLAFAVASIIGSRYVIAQKFRELHAL
jgi:hypothetical protein